MNTLNFYQAIINAINLGNYQSAKGCTEFFIPNDFEILDHEWCYFDSSKGSNTVIMQARTIATNLHIKCYYVGE